MILHVRAYGKFLFLQYTFVRNFCVMYDMGEKSLHLSLCDVYILLLSDEMDLSMVNGAGKHYISTCYLLTGM